MAEYATEKFAKKLLGESEIEAVLQRLDRLTQDEARITVAQTLGVVHGLVGNVKEIMEGAQHFALLVVNISLRLVPSDREASLDSIRTNLVMCLAPIRAKQLFLVLTWGRRRSSPSVNRDKQDEAFVCFFPLFIAEADGIL